MEDKPGYGFRPYDEELVGYYLRNKILGYNRLVEGTISEVNICASDPWDLRFQSKIKSRDPVWYFFSRRENKYANGNRQNRRTPSGFWKLTGESVDVTDRWGHLSGIRGEIGNKRILVFLRGKSTKSDWVIHEFHCTLFPEHARTYVICRLEYKGDDVNILSANVTDPTPTPVPHMANSAGSVVDQSFQGNPVYNNTLAEYDSVYQGQHFNMQQSFQENHLSEYDLTNQSHWFSDNLNLQQQQAPYPAPYEGDQDIWKQLVEESWPSLVDERTCMHEDYNDHRPKNPVSGVFADDSSDDDTDSTIGRDSWSSTDSVGSKNGPYHTPIDDIPLLSTVETARNHEAREQPKQLELQLQGKEKVINKQKCEWKSAEDSTKKASTTTVVKQSWIVLEQISQRNSQWIYFKNMIIGFLLFISIIGWIILVG